METEKKRPIRIDSDELTYEVDVFRFRGKNFTGIAEERAPDGSLISETTYSDGIERGPAKVWHPNGRLRFDYFYASPEEISYFREWYDNGRQMLDKTVRMGRAVSVRKWSRSGELIEDSTC